MQIRQNVLAVSTYFFAEPVNISADTFRALGEHLEHMPGRWVSKKSIDYTAGRCRPSGQ